MAVSHLPDDPEIQSLDVAELLPCKLKDDLDSARQIAHHLEQLLDGLGAGKPPSIRIPSALVLSGFYHRSILDVLDGLHELKKHCYEYVMKGLDADIILHDPMCRRGRKARQESAGWAPGGADVTSPWDPVRRKPHNPLAEIFPRKR